METYTYLQNENGKTVAICNSTGEILDAVSILVPAGSIVYTPESQEAYQNYKKKEQEKAKRINNHKGLGYFYFLKQDHEMGKISPETVGRLIYLFTFLGYDDKQLMIGRNKPMHKSDLPEVMSLSESSIKRFWREASPLYIDVNNKDELILTNDNVIRGKLNNNHELYQKCYIRTIRDVYNKLKPSKHRYLGYIYQILPYINIEYNVISNNPFEVNLQDIIPMTIGEFCEKIGFDSSNFHRLKKVYKNITFDVDGEEQYFLSFVCNENSEDGIKMFVNPRIIYSGSNYSKVEVLGLFSKKTKKK